MGVFSINRQRKFSGVLETQVYNPLTTLVLLVLVLTLFRIMNSYKNLGLSNRSYVGRPKDVLRWLKENNGGFVRSTRMSRPWELIAILEVNNSMVDADV